MYWRYYFSLPIQTPAFIYSLIHSQQCLDYTLCHNPSLCLAIHIHSLSCNNTHPHSHIFTQLSLQRPLPLPCRPQLFTFPNYIVGRGLQALFSAGFMWWYVQTVQNSMVGSYNTYYWTKSFKMLRINWNHQFEFMNQRRIWFVRNIIGTCMRTFKAYT